MSFSKCNKYIAVLITDSAGSNYKAGVYDWGNKNKLLASYDFGTSVITRITFNPKDW